MLPTSTDVTVRTKDRSPATADMVVIFVAEGARSLSREGLSDDEFRGGSRLLAAGVVSGKTRELAFDLVDLGKGKFRRVFVAGLGASDKINAETFRLAGGAIAKAARKYRLAEIAVVIPESTKVTAAESADAVVTGFLLASFKYREYKGKASKPKPGEDRDGSPVSVTIITTSADVKDAVDRAAIVAQAQNFARTIAFRPGNDINPPALAKVAKQVAKETGLALRVLDEKQMAKLGMGGILGVGAGSMSPPRMIVLEYSPRGRTVGATLASPSVRPGKRTAQVSPLLVVGKAITFDTGGISIKPADRMGLMVFDKCGAMAVLGLMVAVARLKPSVPVVGILASAENHISATAYRPGDILRMYNGVTVEVTNTDAEGRLVLGDALAWGIDMYRPSAVVDLATLTGGAVVALGHAYTALMSNDDALTAEIDTASKLAGEKVWRLPLGEEVREMMKSEAADIVNSAGRWASPIQGGVFLNHFIPDRTPWVHLDIAGPADTERELPYYSKGATGWGVRTLVNWVLTKSAEKGKPRMNADKRR